MSRYIPQPAYPDNMPVDISFVFESEKPAGKRGFVKAVGEQLQFEDGTPVRFWGVNFNGGACFPDKDYAPKVARRLAQAGCNMVRFHQLDAEWDTPNIFSFRKGRRVSDTRHLDPKSLDALDYLIHCLKEEGIYCYLDLITYRKFKSGDGVAEYQLLGDAGKPWCMIDPRMIELQKEFNAQLWEHVNPYTGLAYKDDPVFAMTEVINECDMILNIPGAKADYQPCPWHERQFREFMRDWLRENGLEYDWENADFYCHDPILVDFKIHLTKKYYREITKHMRSIGVKTLIAGSNWAPHLSACVKTEEDMDFVDGHHYYYDWKWGNTERTCLHSNITGQASIMPRLGKRKIAGKPFFCSEWDMPWPNSHRAEGPIYYAAVGALQNWSGYLIHTYAYTSELDRMDVLGREVSSPVGGVPYREGIFSVWNDPAKFGLFYHAALMTRRFDVKPANKKVAVQSSELCKSISTAFEGLLEQHIASTVFDGKLPEGYDELVNEADVYPHPTQGKIVSDTGELWRDLGQQIGAVDTDRTKILYGFLGRNRPVGTRVGRHTGVDLKDVHIDCKTDFAVVAMSSLTDAPISQSDNILLTTIGRARNSGAQFDGIKMLDVGHAPIMAEVIDATIRIRTEKGADLKVWGVNAEGFYAGNIPTTYEDGILSFRVGDENNPACYYLIVAD